MKVLLGVVERTGYSEENLIKKSDEKKRGDLNQGGVLLRMIGSLTC
jgi:hypothetical protein